EQGAELDQPARSVAGLLQRRVGKADADEEGGERAGVDHAAVEQEGRQQRHAAQPEPRGNGYGDGMERVEALAAQLAGQRAAVERVEAVDELPLAVERLDLL